MNNLKRILSLALASVMVMGMMVTGASAAKFSDAEDIDHTAAVDVAAALGIIKGMDDGSFNPGGDVTRAQMAKMLTVVMNGKEPNLGKPTTATFADSANHWAVEFIEYCANTGIINGRSATTFDPEGKVTAAEAAKMILVALGFDADVFGLVGANWSTNTMTLAQNLLVGGDKDTLAGARTLNLFSGLGNIGANTPLTRDQAAQLIYNGITTPTVKMALTGVTGGNLTGILGGASGQTPTYSWSLQGEKLIESKFNAKVDEGVLTAAAYDDDAESWDYSICYYNSDNVLGTTPTVFTFEEDISDRFMQSVRVIYRNNRNKTVLAITAAGDDVVEDFAWGDVSKATNKAAVNGYELGIKEMDDGDEIYFTTDNLPVYLFLNTTAGTIAEGKEDGEGDAAATSYTYEKYDEAKLIDNNGDGRIDCIVVTPVTVDQVVFTRPTYIQLANMGDSLVLADHNVEEGLEVGEFVTYTINPQTGVNTVVKAETVTGALTASQAEIINAQGVVTRPNRVQVDGEWYTVLKNYTDGAKIKDLVGKDVELVLAAGYVVNGKELGEKTTTSNAVMVVAQAEKTYTNKTTVNGSTEYLEVRVLKADNTTEDLKVVAVGDDAVVAHKAADDESEGEDEGNVFNGTLYTYSAHPTKAGYVILRTYTADVATDGDVQSPEYDDKLTGSNIKVGGGLVYNSEKSFRIDEDGVIFVITFNDGEVTDYAAMKGSDIAKWNKSNDYDAEDGTTVYADRSTANGYQYAKAGIIVLDNLDDIPGATGEKTYYGYVTANAHYTKSAGTTYVVATVWNGAENITVRAKSLTSNKDAVTQGDEKNFLVGTLVSFKDNGDGTAGELTAVKKGSTEDPYEPVAVTAWDGSCIKFYDDESEETPELIVDNATNILFVNHGKKEGTDGTIVLSQYVNAYDVTKGRYANVLYVDITPGENGDKGHVNILVLDTTGKIAKSSTAYFVVGAEPEPEEPAEHTHTLSELTGASQATCAQDGNKGYYTCTAENCTEEEGTKFDAQKNKITDEESLKIAKETVDHTAPDSVTEGSGTHSYTCEVCSQSVTEDCDTDGTDGACSVCGYKANA